MVEITECDDHDRDEFWRNTPQDVTTATETGEQARTAPAPHFIICGRCDAVWTTGLVPADQAEQELRAYLAAYGGEPTEGEQA